MPITSQQQKTITEIDLKVNAVLAGGGDEKTLLVAMIDQMPAIKTIMDACSEGEMEELCNQHEGFFQFMKLLENLAQGIASGDIKVPQ